MFSDQERDYLRNQPLARIATVDEGGQVDVAPVIYRFDGRRFYISGLRMARTLKYRNVARGNTRVALVVDDLASRDPWQPRGVKVHGTAEIIKEPGKAPYLKITPTTHWSWGLEEPGTPMRRHDW